MPLAFRPGHAHQTPGPIRETASRCGRRPNLEILRLHLQRAPAPVSDVKRNVTPADRAGDYSQLAPSAWHLGAAMPKPKPETCDNRGCFPRPTSRRPYCCYQAANM